MHGVRAGASATREASNVRRRLLTIAIFLLAGAVVNLAVAWGLAAFVTSTELFSFSALATVI